MGALPGARAAQLAQQRAAAGSSGRGGAAGGAGRGLPDGRARGTQQPVRLRRTWALQGTSGALTPEGDGRRREAFGKRLLRANGEGSSHEEEKTAAALSPASVRL